ncbi:MAG: 2-hydroxyacid dehydrogenase [Phenylobacterium sp.]|uniref:2-hydroxyacid dehydrogenase n=1 Tax=Phenylobacterium sp. TaxID=1871053 RepID=UPI00391BD333
MRVAVFSARPYDERFLHEANLAIGHELTFFETRLSAQTVDLVCGFEVICAFVNDELDAEVLRRAQEHGVRLVALRAAGVNNVDLRSAAQLGLTIAHVPAYSPHAVAEHTLALILTLNRKTHRAYNRVREGNFALDGLLGFDLHGKCAGVVGAGAIGGIVARLLSSFGCRVVVSDPSPNPALAAAGIERVSLEELFAAADIVSLHCPLVPATYRLINAQTIMQMKPGVMLVNTSRGGVIDTRAVIAALKSGAIGSLAVDVYEEEGGLFFDDRSQEIISDDVFARLLTFPNVLVTGHQGFFTTEALSAIAETTLANISAFEASGQPLHQVPAPPHAAAG